MTSPTQPNAPHLTPEQQKAEFKAEINRIRTAFDRIRALCHAEPSEVAEVAVERTINGLKGQISQTQSALEQSEKQKELYRQETHRWKEALEQAQRERDEAKWELSQITFVAQKHQPAGSPPPGNSAILVIWIFDSLLKQRDELQVKCAKLEAACAEMRSFIVSHQPFQFDINTEAAQKHALSTACEALKETK